MSVNAAAVPGLVILMAGVLLPDTPASYAERNMLDKAKAVLMRVRGIRSEAEVQPEYQDIVEVRLCPCQRVLGFRVLGY